jgi:hypothetical protein
MLFYNQFPDYLMYSCIYNLYHYVLATLNFINFSNKMGFENILTYTNLINRSLIYWKFKGDNFSEHDVKLY